MNDNKMISSMSFNVFYNADEAHMERVVKLIKNYMPDTLGVQEATTEWMEYLRTELGELYGDVGLGREGGSEGEHSAVFYKKERFALLEGATKWLSDTPDVEGSRFEGANHRRVMSYALLKDKNTGSSIMHINTHLGLEAQLRPKQLNVLIEETKKLPKVPFIVTGDYNWDDTASLSEAMKALDCVNGASIAKQGDSDTTPTFRGWKEGTTPRLIDYVYITADSADMEHYQVCTEQVDGDYPSDHYPLLARWYVK